MINTIDKLLGYLHKVFDKDPEKQLAMRFSYDGSMTWAVSDSLLTTTVSGGAGKNLAVQLDNTGLICNGINNYFYVPVDSAQPIYEASLPLEINADFSISAYPLAVSPFVSKNSSYELGMATDGRLAIRIETDEAGLWVWQYFSFVVPINSLMSIKVIFDGVDIQLFVDGVLKEAITSSQSGSMSPNENNIYFGASESGGSLAYSMAVKFYGFSVTNNSLTKLALSFDELFGKYLIDITGSGQVGILVNGPKWESITLAEIYAYIASQTDYTGSFLDADLAELSGSVLIEDTKNQSSFNGDHLYAFTSLLWVVVNTFASSLFLAKTHIGNMLEQMSLATTAKSWVDFWGGVFGFKRLANEEDNHFRNRIIQDVVQVKANNIALEKILLEVTGLSIQVVDIDWVNNPDDILGQLGLTALKPGSPPSGGYPYWGAPVNDNPLVCTFAVIIGVASLSDISELDKTTIKDLVEKNRISGTYAKYFGPVGNFLYTNTAGDNTNDIAKLSGPKPASYQEIVL